MNIDQVYDELYGVIDRNKAADAATQGRVAALEDTVSTQGTTIASHTGQIAALQEVIPEVPGRRLKLVDLGTEYTQELKEDIYTGAFEKAVVGGFLTINDHVYVMAHDDYWLNTGDQGSGVIDHHMLIVPLVPLATGKMNQSSTTEGGYALSDMRVGHEDTTDPENPFHVDGALQAVIDMIETDFGSDNILTHRDVFVKTVSNDSGIPSARDWYDSKIDLMNELMVYGCPVFTVSNNGTSTPTLHTVDKTQLKLFAERPDLITSRGNAWWLRDTVNAAAFARVTGDGMASNLNASNAIGIRPVFAIKGAPPETRTKKRKG